VYKSAPIVAIGPTFASTLPRPLPDGFRGLVRARP
jgi:hypothetical protein